MKNTFGVLILAFALFAPTVHVHAFSIGGFFGCAAGQATGAGSTIAKSAAMKVVAVTVDAPIANQELATKNAKECILDGLVVAIRQGIITATTQSIVNWINNGFEGGPSFVTDLNRFMGEVADNISLDFIRGTELGFLCSPFSLNVRIALTTERQPFYQRASCSLGEVTGNIDRFFEGDFSQGGWPAWFRVATNIQNNPYGAYLIAQGELDARITSSQGEEIQLLNFGRGFFSPRRCVKRAPSTGDEPGKCLEEEITTPGTIVNDTLSDHLGSGLRQLELADEIDEIIDALLAQLARQVVTGVQGLRGLSSSSTSGGQGSFLQRMVDESATGARGAVADAVGGDINQSIQTENEYRAFLEGVLLEFDGMEARLALFEQCGAPISDDGRDILSGIGMAEPHSETLIAFIRTTIESSRELYFESLVLSQEASTELSDMYVDLLRAPTLNAMEPGIRTYDSFIRAGTLRNASDFAIVESGLSSLRLMMQAVDTSINESCAAPMM